MERRRRSTNDSFHGSQTRQPCDRQVLEGTQLLPGVLLRLSRTKAGRVGAALGNVVHASVAHWSMVKMGSVALTVLSMTIGFFFIFVGTLKLTPSVNSDVYKEMRRSFVRNAKVFPFVKQTGWKPNPHVYRKIIGSLEVVCGVTLVVIPGPLKDISNLLLILVMLNDIYTHYALQEGLDRMTPAIVFLLLLTCRLIIHAQVKARDRRSVFEKRQPFPEPAEPSESRDEEKKEN